MIFEPSDQEHRLKWVFSSCKNGAWGTEPDGRTDVVCIRAADFDGRLGRLNNGERTLRSIDPDTYEKLALRSGDVVLEKSGGGEKQLVGRAVLFDGEKPSITSNFLARCRPAPGMEPAFVNYLLLAIYNARGTFPHLKQSTGIQNLDLANFLNIRVSIPPLDTQRRIARFLDEKTARIDGLIEKKRELLDRLAEKRQALITRTVTKGLNPDAPMKSSGIDWLGDIPAYWEIRPLTKCTNRIDYRGATPEKSSSGVFLVTAKNIKNGQIDYEASKEYIPEETYEYVMRRGKPKLGEVLFTTEAPLGEIARVDHTDIALAQRIIKFSTALEDLTNDYLAYWMYSSAFRADVVSRATGSTALGIKASKLVELRCLLPPKHEQAKISRGLDHDAAERNDAVTEIQTSVERLTEYRAALITAAVTGRIAELR